MFPLSAPYPPVPLLAQTRPPLTPLWDHGCTPHPLLPCSPQQLCKPQRQQLGTRDNASVPRVEVQQRASTGAPNHYPDGGDSIYLSHTKLGATPIWSCANKSCSISSQNTFSSQGVNLLIACPEELRVGFFGSGSAQLCWDPQGLLRNPGHFLLAATEMGRGEKEEIISSWVLYEALKLPGNCRKSFSILRQSGAVNFTPWLRKIKDAQVDVAHVCAHQSAGYFRKSLTWNWAFMRSALICLIVKTPVGWDQNTTLRHHFFYPV